MHYLSIVHFRIDALYIIIVYVCIYVTMAILTYVTVSVESLHVSLQFLTHYYHLKITELSHYIVCSNTGISISFFSTNYQVLSLFIFVKHAKIDVA